MIADCTALILAGGESSRMGQDKAGLLLGARTLLQRVTDIVQPMFADTLVSVREMRTDCTLPQVCDDPSFAGPLAGLVAGMRQAKTPWLFAVACDMPFVTPELIEHLAQFRAGAEAVVPVVQGHPQPMAAFYATHSLDNLHQMRGGRQSLRALLETLQVRYVDEDELQAADLRSFFDLDTPDDVRRAITMENKT